MMRFYFDENLSDELAKAARRSGLDVTCSHEIGRDGDSDDAQFEFAVDEP